MRYPPVRLTPVRPEPVRRTVVDRGPAQLVLVLLATLVAVLGGPGAGPAAAHDALVTSEPADGQALDEAPSQVVLTFSQPQVEVGSAVSVVGPDGREWADGAPALAEAQVIQELAPGMPGGAYTVDWRTVASDGHPISGTFTFVVDVPAAPGGDVVDDDDGVPAVTRDDAVDDGETSAGTASATREPSDEPGAPTDTVPGAEPWMLGVLALGVLGALVVVVVRLRDQRSGDG